MAIFPTNAHRIDPYKNFKFQILDADGTPIAGMSKMSAIKRTTEVIEWREAGGPSIVRKVPGRSKFEPVTLERGITQDDAFARWANQVNNILGDAAMSLRGYRKTIAINLLNLQGFVAKRFFLYRAWVSEFQALPEMDSNANAIAIEMVKLEFEGFALDETVVEPVET